MSGEIAVPGLSMLNGKALRSRCVPEAGAYPCVACEARHRAMLEAIPDIILVLSGDGAFIDYKPGRSTPLYAAPESFLGKNLSEVMPPELAARAQRHIDMALKTGKVQNFAYDLAYKGEKTPRSFEARMSVSGENQVIVVVQDVTSRVALEAELVRARKLESTGRLAGGVAHDFNNLLTVINGCGDFLLAGMSEDNPDRSSVEAIRKAGEQAAALTRQLLSFSRQQPVSPQLVDLNHLVEDNLDMLRRLAGGDVEVRTIAEPELGAVMADPGMLHQVLLNLTANARDAITGQGTLTFKTANVALGEEQAALAGVRPGSYVRLTVSDTGVGMDDKTQERIFEPFFTTKGLNGTGLGLSTVYGIVRQSHGGIRVTSEQGHGTTFTIDLPLVEAARAPAPPMAADEEPGGTETVLLVEDQHEVRKVVAQILKSNGYEVLESATALDAILTAASYPSPIHLLVTDIVMPVMNGKELAAILKPGRPDLRILYMSGYTDTVVSGSGILGNGAEYIEKPFAASDLARKVREILTLPQAVRAAASAR